MEDAGGKNGISLTGNQSLVKVFQGAGAATSDDRYGYCLGDSSE